MTGEQVAIDVERHRNRRVTEALLDDLRGQFETSVELSIDAPARRVAQRMKALVLGDIGDLTVRVLASASLFRH